MEKAGSQKNSINEKAKKKKKALVRVSIKTSTITFKDRSSVNTCSMSAIKIIKNKMHFCHFRRQHYYFLSNGLYYIMDYRHF